MEQVATLKSLVKRDHYTLSTQQQKFIHMKFFNLDINPSGMSSGASPDNVISEQQRPTMEAVPPEISAFSPAQRVNEVPHSITARSNSRGSGIQPGYSQQTTSARFAMASPSSRPGREAGYSNAQALSPQTESSISLNPHKFRDRETGIALRQPQPHYQPDGISQQEADGSYYGNRDTYKDQKSFQDGAGYSVHTFGGSPNNNYYPEQSVSHQRNQQAGQPADNAHMPKDMINDSFGPMQNQEPNTQKRHLICALKIELDGDNTEEIQVYEGDDPRITVQQFSREMNLSSRAEQ